MIELHLSIADRIQRHVLVLAAALVATSPLAQGPIHERGSVEKSQEIDATDSRTEADASLRTVLYDVRDLLEPLLEQPMEDEEQGARLVRLAQRRSEFVSDAKRWMEPQFDASWTLAMTDESLAVASVPAKAHEWLAAFIEAGRQSRGALYSIEMRWLSGPTSSFDPFAIERQTKRLADEEVALLEGPGLQVLASPKVMVFPWQRAQVEVMSETAYVRDYQLVVVAPGDQLIADPIIDTVKDGVSTDCRVTPLPNGRLGLHLEARLAKLVQPIPTHEITLAEGLMPVWISTPEVQRISLQTRIALHSGDQLLVTGRSRYPDGTIRSPFAIDDEDGTRREFAVAICVTRHEPAALLEGGSNGEPNEPSTADDRNDPAVREEAPRRKDG